MPVELRIVDDLSGGLVRLAWRKCRGYNCGFGTVSPTAFEWFYERVEQDPSAPDAAVGAHLSRKDWKP